MATHDASWTAAAHNLSGPGFECFQIELTKYNARQLMPTFPTRDWRDEVEDYARVARAEGEYIEAVRSKVAPLLTKVPSAVDDFIIGLRNSSVRVRDRGTSCFLGWPEVLAGRTCCGF